MKTTEEFPATHSMSTDWFIADEEGNIALFSFDENGPVPIAALPGGGSDLLTGEEDFGEKDENSIDYFELTDEQVEELMSDAVSTDKFDFENNSDCLFVQVDEPYRKEFLEFFTDKVWFCLSHKHGIYFGDWLSSYEKPDDYRKKAMETLLRTVKRVVHIWIDNYTEDDVENLYKTGWKLPFYCYKQPYSSNIELAKRTNIPKFPFKEEQLAEKQRKKLIRVPLKFSECTGLQIAQYALCEWYNIFDSVEINGRDYTEFPKTGGGYIYVLTHQDEYEDGEKPITVDGED